MPSLDITHFLKNGDLIFKKSVEAYSGPHPPNAWDELYSAFQELKLTFAAIVREFPVASVKFEAHPRGDLSTKVCRSALLDFLSTTHHFLKICGVIYLDFKRFMGVADRSVSELVHRFNHQATVNFKGFLEFETLVEDCMDLVNNDSFYQSRIKFQRAMATHMELFGKIKDFRRITANQIVCVDKARALVEFSLKIPPYLDLIRHYIDRLCERDELVCTVNKIRSPSYSCCGHAHVAVKRAFSGVCAYHLLFISPLTFAVRVMQYENTLLQVDNEAKKSEWILEHFYRYRLLPVQEKLHENIVWREKALGEGIICD